MIALPAISQRNYIINNDTIVGYTKSENRKIAIIFVQGDSCKETSVVDKEIIYRLNDDINSYKLVSNALMQKLTISEGKVATLNTKLDESIQSENKSHRWAAFWRTTTLGAVLGIIISVL